MIKKLLKLNIFVIIIILIFNGCNSNSITTNLNFEVEKPVKVGVLLYKADDEYISLISENLKEIEKGNQGKVEFIFFDAENNQVKQNQQLRTALSQDIDLLLVNLVDVSENSTQTVINRIKEKNLPVIIFNREPISKNPIKSYNNAIVLSTNSEEAGILQGGIIVDLWKENRLLLDTNRDNILQYVILTGNKDNIDAIARTKYSIETIEKAGIKTQELALRIANWDSKLAQEEVRQLFYQYGNRIEAIISNNDAMAEGAIQALQEFGYNKGDNRRTITVVGVDGTPEAQKLIKQGYMAGTVIQDPKAEAQALYTLGMNMVEDKSPIEGTDYKFDESGVAVRLSFEEYIQNQQ
ncbi:galactose ABC transporter substrate-binding protein [Clostridium weizhouense]|uniref:D-galactose/methyl-galactoside binding periplasmic protein MglB n=1 Tax=Clostridium weizhouense TaxID=2859781 RepID=A0ABS7AN27_9CLOT|nr:galactose ABC transporter substrate-binding protein [Clostridium weizhouense]MBW6410052.1 galactose ABC transporter substrate-binding protein [Clostridium weizhouense]